MSIQRIPEKFWLQLFLIFSAIIILFCCFVVVDRYLERDSHIKLAELGYNYSYEKEIK